MQKELTTIFTANKRGCKKSAPPFPRARKQVDILSPFSYSHPPKLMLKNKICEMLLTLLNKACCAVCDTYCGESADDAFIAQVVGSTMGPGTAIAKTEAYIAAVITDLFIGIVAVALSAYMATHGTPLNDPLLLGGLIGGSIYTSLALVVIIDNIVAMVSKRKPFLPCFSEPACL